MGLVRLLVAAARLAHQARRLQRGKRDRQATGLSVARAAAGAVLPCRRPQTGRRGAREALVVVAVVAVVVAAIQVWVVRVVSVATATAL